MRWTRRCRRRTALKRTAKSCGPDASTLASSFCGSIRESDGGKKARSPGRARYKRKTIAQGKPDASAGPVCSCAFCFVQFAHETAGAARTRLSLRPLLSRARIFSKARAHRVARMRTHVQLSSSISGDTDDRIEKPQQVARSEPFVGRPSPPSHRPVPRHPAPAWPWRGRGRLPRPRRPRWRRSCRSDCRARAPSR